MLSSFTIIWGKKQALLHSGWQYLPAWPVYCTGISRRSPVMGI